jgi:hypothetical protein
MDHHLSWMPVSDEAGRVAGVLARSDVLTIFLRDDASIQTEIVRDVLLRSCARNPRRYGSRSRAAWSRSPVNSTPAASACV